jgi:hypothetical protein
MFLLLNFSRQFPDMPVCSLVPKCNLHLCIPLFMQIKEIIDLHRLQQHLPFYPIKEAMLHHYQWLLQ